MLAEYGGAEWADEQARAQLLTHYVRRKQFEARLIAVEVSNIFSGGDGDSGHGGQERVSGAELLAMAGISL